nr:5-oxoprolinase subunit PxpB [uncultured Bacillus sp.]
MDYQLSPLGDQAVMIGLGEHADETTLNKVQLLTSYLDTHPFDWMIEYIPAFTSVAILYDPILVSQHLRSKELLPYHYVCEQLIPLLAQNTNAENIERQTIQIPVCYGGAYGPDLEFVAVTNHLSLDEVIQVHSSGDYTVHMIGFAPGFPYIYGMPESIAAPRKKTPQLKIPAKSVGIGGKQTGIYPIESPGGWQIIGRTPLNLFNPEARPPSRLKVGDKIQFIPISDKEYAEWEISRR